MLINNSEYFDVLESIKSQIKAAQYRAVVGANRELLTLYWNIGNVILGNKSWGNKFVENLSRDIKADFPNVTGYSVRNLKYMQKFAATYPDLEFVQSVTAQIPWTHNKSILDKVKEKEQMDWYILKTSENGWTVDILEHQIESKLYHRQILADKTTNYSARLESTQSELAVQTLKDPYWFDFIETKEKMIERDIELLKKDGDNPSIGLILCRDKNKTVAEYALRDMTKPIGVSEYKLTEYLPQELEKTLPSVEDIEKRVKAKYDLSGENI